MDDWAYCQEALREVSRTFSKPIEALEGELRRAVTCGYLLCRIADTVEDHPSLSLATRDALFDAFLGALERGDPSDRFVALFADVPREGAGAAEHELSRSLARVLAVFRATSAARQAASVPWIAEMVRGMQLYRHRPPGPDGLISVDTLEDLERYCWFVAGTVGRMLTELFIHELGGAAPEREHALRTHAESFGLGLQLVNVLKDVTDDKERSISYVPRQLVAAEGLRLDQLTDPAHRDAAHRALAPVFDRAERALDGAVEYILALPPDARTMRLFCMMPAWMAVRTLALARGNDAQLVAGEKVKITRDEVQRLIEDCTARVGDDAAIREGYATLVGG